MKIRIRRIMIPILFCFAIACLIEIPLFAENPFGKETTLWDLLFRAVAAVPVLFCFYREDRVFRGKIRFNAAIAVFLLILGAALSVLLSAAITGLGIPGAEAAQQTLFAGSFRLQAVVLLIASPLLEELFFRGVFYGRLKELLPIPASVLISSAVFGIYHANLAQGIFGFLMGIVLACAMERYQTVAAPVLIHAAANGAALFAAHAKLP